MKKLIFLWLFVNIGCGLSSKQQEDYVLPPSGNVTPPRVEQAPPQQQAQAASAGAAAEKREEPPPPPPPKPVNPSFHEALSNALKTQNDEEINKVAHEILFQNPNDPRALNTLAMYNYKQGKIDYAKMILSKSIKTNPNVPTYYTNLGVIYLNESDKDKKEINRKEAIKNFRKALGINPADAIAAANLGSLYAENKDYAKALPLLELAFRTGVKDPRVMNNYAVSLMRMGRPEGAGEILKQGLETQKGSPELWFNYAVVTIDYLNQFQEGIGALDQLRLIGAPENVRPRINELENKAKASVK